MEQKSREAKALKEVEVSLARKRQSEAGKVFGVGMEKLVPVSAPAIEQEELGKSRNIVAKKVGLRSGHEVDRAISTIRIIDKLETEGRTEEADLKTKQDVPKLAYVMEMILDVQNSFSICLFRCSYNYTFINS